MYAQKAHILLKFIMNTLFLLKHKAYKHIEVEIISKISIFKAHFQAEKDS